MDLFADLPPPGKKLLIFVPQMLSDRGKETK
jgi:hypothetical protein